MFNGAEDAFEYGNMLEWLVNCFLEALEENPIADIKVRNSCSGLIKSENIWINGA